LGRLLRGCLIILLILKLKPQQRFEGRVADLADTISSPDGTVAELQFLRFPRPPQP